MVSAIKFILNSADPLLTNTITSYNNTNFSIFMGVCAELLLPSRKASYVMKKKVNL
jgi:hypothetical protein